MKFDLELSTRYTFMQTTIHFQNSTMTPENKQRIKDAAKDAGDFLNGKLIDIPNLPKRNSWAHIWKCIKDEMGLSYKDCDNDQVEQILKIIKYHKENDGKTK
jgi:hypothetical protein